MTEFERARQQVTAGTDPVVAAGEVVAAMTDEELLWCLDGDAPAWAGLEFLGKGGYHEAPFFAARVPRLGFPGVAFSDGPRGVVIGNATCFPVSMARGATWDPELEERIGDAIGRELRAAGATWYGGVCVNLLRHPAWGRAQETYGEDPHHVGELGAALTRGVQRHAMATVKHFAVNSMENARFRVDVVADEVALHEVYLPHFRRIVDEGVAAVMSSYNQLNGVYCGDHRELLTSILRDEWGFEGFVTSDWIFGLRDAAASVRAGLDLEMPYRMVRATHLPNALAAGEVTWDEVRTCVTRLVATVLRFDHVLTAEPEPTESFVPLAREAAARSIVLLRNEAVGGRPVLPLAADDLRTIVVIGRLADRANLGDGGSSDVYSLDNVTALAGIREAAPSAEVLHDLGHDPAEAARTATDADVAIVVVGYTSDDEGEFIGDPGIDLQYLFPPGDEPEVVERFRNDPRLPTVRPDHVRSRPGLGFSIGGDRSSLQLGEGDEALIRAVAAANPRTVVVIQAGSAVVVSGWIDRVPAVVQAWYGGQQAGYGLADVLFGEVDPSARLPFTVPTDPAHLPAFDRDADRVVYDRWHGWWRSERLGLAPQFPFGFGLSYTEHRLVDAAATVDQDGVTVRCTVANTGRRHGADVVQVYARLADPEAPRRLVGFARVEVDAGESREATIPVPWNRFEQRSEGSWSAPRGPIELVVARHAADPEGIHLPPIDPPGR